MDSLLYKQTILDNGYVTKTNLQGVITFANENFCKISGYSESELIGKSHNIIKSPDENEKNFQKMWASISAGKKWKGVIKNRAKDGTSFYMDTTIYPIIDENGVILEYIAFRNNLTGYIYLLNHDNLTGLKNREAFRTITKLSDKKYVVGIVNIDSFSEINEFYGGFIGDKVIINTSKILRKIFKDDFDIYRLQGDEFAVLKVMDMDDEYNAEIELEELNNKIRSYFEQSVDIEDIEFSITVTSGFYVGCDNLLRNSNIAFKNAKSKNLSYSIYDEKMLSKFTDFSKNRKLAIDVREAIKDNQVTPFYQPIICNKTKEVVKYEALARLVKDTKVVPPSEFIDVSKKIKYYNIITRSMIKKSFEDVKNLDGIGISINITIEDISNIRTFNYILEELAINGDNSNITFEIVESDGIEDFELFNKFVKTIKQFGAKISIDDFGTGYSNFAYLSKIEPDFLKIDGSLIKNIENRKDFDVVKTIVEFAKMYNIKTIAEFVENEEIFILIKELGIDYSQGYHFGKPVSFDKIIKRYNS